jgi:hypothetical protein
MKHSWAWDRRAIFEACELLLIFVLGTRLIRIGAGRDIFDAMGECTAHGSDGEPCELILQLRCDYFTPHLGIPNSFKSQERI